MPFVEPHTRREFDGTNRPVQQQIQGEHEDEDNCECDHEGEESEALLLSKSDMCEGLDISRSYISDKSNASGLVKAIVCIQALWLCIQALSRVLQSLYRLHD
jgi:hypothetical protein